MLHIEVGSDSKLIVHADNAMDKNHDALYPMRNMIFTVNGKAAINLILASLNLKLQDEVFITSSYGAKYVSKCVTCSVFNHCQPSKVYTPQTKVIYIIHEFGVPHPDTEELLKLGLEKNIPVIEDCAHSSNSYFEDGTKVGAKGDFAIYSLKKILPMEQGGALRINNEKYFSQESIEQLKTQFNLYQIESTFLEYINRESEFSELRRRNFTLLQDAIRYRSHFKVNPTISPYVFSFEYPQPAIFVKHFNEHYGNRFECVQWFGMSIVSFPVHQFITLDLINELIQAIESTAQTIEESNVLTP
jgi:dTDP-4-amino-4,6-dideoxygalactose transaminase